MGDCYEANGRYFSKLPYDDKKWKLVHGVAILQTDGKPFGHCWLEKGDKCHDFSNGKSIVLPKELYYGLGGMPVKGYKNYKYNRKQFNEKILKYETWGPWDSKAPR